MFGSIGTPEIIGILVLFLLLFGAKKLPEFARSIGHALREFRKSTSELKEELTQSIDFEVEREPEPMTYPAQTSYCQSCGTTIPIDATFCPSCGKSTGNTIQCPDCQSEIPAESVFCLKCGSRIKPENEVSQPSSDALD